ncbi:MAG: methylmalonyl-CoA epimerase [Bacteroidetes bacterium]|nr:methylmalonyl-CoA epimerase [Bacteroidota bacterium]
MKKIEHIGIAVKRLAEAIPVYEKLLQTKCYKTEEVTSENVCTAFFQIGDTKIELLESTTEDGVIAKFIEKKGEGLHHIAFEVDNINEQIHHASPDFHVLQEKPKAGADNKQICFLHPKDTHGVLVEFCQEQ